MNIHFFQRYLPKTAGSVFAPIGLLFCLSSFGQNIPINQKLLHGQWNAQWITCPDVAARAYGVYHFRKTMQLSNPPSRFIIHVSADNRYILYINGKQVGRGPARGDLYHWNFESYDIASYLQPGKNVIAAVVWNMGEYAPVAQISNQTGFLLQGDTNTEEIANTNKQWKVLHDTAYQPCALNIGSVLHSYVAVGAGDEVKGMAYPWEWEKTDYVDASWQQAKELRTPVVTTGYGTDNFWTLTPRTIPPMEEKMQRLSLVRRTMGVSLPSEFINGNKPFNIPANTHEVILLDQSFETVAYPVLKMSKGKNAVIKITYAEALFDKNDQKGNRNEIESKTIKGLFDIFYPDGGNDRTFTPLWFRTYRYLQLDIQTSDEPLTINDIYGIYTGYPFEQKATFSSNDPSLQNIWEVGWQTARLCAGETYFDCPYYEQLQYEGDTRIQALISLYNTNDDRLVRKAINDFFLSRVPDGLTQGRYPSNRLQVIPPYSWFWISMLYDYWMHRTDDVFLKKYLDAAEIVLKWYEQHIDSNYGMLGPMEWWNFVDWDDAFPGGTPDGATDGHSSVITLQYAYTLQQAAKLFDHFGRKETAGHYSKLAKQLAENTYRNCFDHEKMEMANQPLSDSVTNKFSQHAGILAILSDAIPIPEQKKVIEKILYDSTMSQATFYFRFYLTRAMVQSGEAELYYSQLTPWRDMLKIGLTTFAEKPDPTRSDCHAWSASPDYDFLATICGIMPDAPGFSKVLIQPALGELTEVKGTMPVPGGTISVSLKRNKTGMKGEVLLPGAMKGKLIWNGNEVQLHGGKQAIGLVSKK
jgi:hypothetical protein